MNEIKTERALTTAPETHRSKRIKSYAVLNSNSHKKQKIEHSLVKEILDLENNEVSPPLTKGKENNKPYKESCRFDIKSMKKTECLEEESRIGNYAGFAKIFDGKDEKICCLELKITKLEGKLREMGLSNEKKSVIMKEQENICLENEELKMKISELLKGTEILCREKEGLIKKNKLLCFENEELTVMIATLKQEYSESKAESEVVKYERIEEIEKELIESIRVRNVEMRKLKESENEIKICKEKMEEILCANMKLQNKLDSQNIEHYQFINSNFEITQTEYHPHHPHHPHHQEQVKYIPQSINEKEMLTTQEDCSLTQQNKKILQQNNETDGIQSELYASFMLSSKVKLCHQEEKSYEKISELEELLREKNNKIDELNKKLCEKSQQMEEDSNKSEKLQKYVKKMEAECSELVSENERILKSVEKESELNGNEILNKKVNEKNIEINSLNAQISTLQNKLTEYETKYLEAMHKLEQATHHFSIQNEQQRNLSQIHELETTMKQKSFEFKIELNEYEQREKLLISKLSLEKAEKENIKKHNVQLQYQIRNLEEALQEETEHIVVLNQNHKDILQQFHAKIEQEQQHQKYVPNQIEHLQNLCNEQIVKINELTNLNFQIGEERECLQESLQINQNDQEVLLLIQKEMKVQIQNLEQELRESKQLYHESQEQLLLVQQTNLEKILKIEELEISLEETKYKFTEEQRIKETIAYEHRKHIEILKMNHSEKLNQFELKSKENEALQNEIQHLETTIENYRQSEELLFANYEQSLQINAQNEKIIQQLTNECHQKEMSEAKLSQNNTEEQIYHSNYERIKQQMETVTKKYLEVEEQLQQSNEKNKMINSCLNELEQRNIKEKEYSQELSERLTEKEIENCALLRKEEHMRTEKKQLEESVKFLSEELGIWSHKYENMSKEYEILKEEMGSMKTSSKIFQKESKASFENNNSCVSMKSKERVSKEIERNLENYKLEIKILKQEKEILEVTMETELNKRKEMIECLIKEKNMLYEQMTARALNC